MPYIKTVALHTQPSRRPKHRRTLAFLGHPPSMTRRPPLLHLLQPPAPSKPLTAPAPAPAPSLPPPNRTPKRRRGLCVLCTARRPERPNCAPTPTRGPALARPTPSACAWRRCRRWAAAGPQRECQASSTLWGRAPHGEHSMLPRASLSRAGEHSRVFPSPPLCLFWGLTSV